MSSTFPYTIQPQPPPHPKTTGGKRGPSAPITIPPPLAHQNPSSGALSEDEDSDQSITDHTPPAPSKIVSCETNMNLSPNNKTSHMISVNNCPTSPRAPLTVKKIGNLSSPRILSHSTITNSSSNNSQNVNNNNHSTVNLNHQLTSLQSNVQQNLITSTNSTTTPILIIHSNKTPSKFITGSINENVPSKVNSNNNIVTNVSNVHTNDSNSQGSNFSLPAPSQGNKPWQGVISRTETSNIHFPKAAKVIENVSTTNTVSSLSKNNNVNDNCSNQNHDMPQNAGVEGVAEESSTTAKESDPEHNSSPVVSSCSNHSPRSNSRERSCSPFSNFAYEHDHDYDNVASPCSSTASGPIYVRPPGFKHHAQEFVVSPSKSKLKKKKSSMTLINLREGFKKRESTPPKLKPKRDPLPMKLRALPQSFWQQPNVAQQVSPATLFPILPPLSNKDNEEVLMDVRPITPPHDKERKVPERKLTVANTDLLFKLFEGIGDDKKPPSHPSNHRTRTQTRPPKPIHKSNTKGLLMGNDPYMVDAVTEKIFPQLTLEGSKTLPGGGNTSLQLITLKEGDRTVQLPSLSMEQNYPQMLSELVMHI